MAIHSKEWDKEVSAGEKLSQTLGNHLLSKKSDITIYFSTQAPGLHSANKEHWNYGNFQMRTPRSKLEFCPWNTYKPNSWKWSTRGARETASGYDSCRCRLLWPRGLAELSGFTSRSLFFLKLLHMLGKSSFHFPLLQRKSGLGKEQRVQVSSSRFWFPVLLT